MGEYYYQSGFVYVSACEEQTEIKQTSQTLKLNPIPSDITLLHFPIAVTEYPIKDNLKESGFVLTQRS